MKFAESLELGERIIYRFDFNHDNFPQVSQELCDFITMSKRNNISIALSRILPPCIKLENFGQNIISSNNLVKLNNKNIILHHNFLYGEEHIDLNKKFIDSPFISERCRSCEYNKSFMCRGVTNAKFDIVKTQLSKKIGSDNYDAVKSDFENGQVVAGSFCSINCKFCFDKYLPNRILKFIPLLQPMDIMHFLHYTPKLIEHVGVPYHCKSGEITQNPNFIAIIDIIKHFAKKHFTIITSGYGLTPEMIEYFKEIKPHIALSVNSFNEEMLNKFMPGVKKINLLKIIGLLKEYQIPYHIGIIPLKSFIENEDIYSTIEKLRFVDPNCAIRISKSTWSNYLAPEIVDEMDVYYSFKEQIKKREKSFWFCDDKDMMDFDVYNFDEKIKGIIRNIEEFALGVPSSLLLCPFSTYSQFKVLESNSIKVFEVESSIGFNNPSAGVLLVQDYIDAFEKCKNNNHRFNALFIPRSTFDVNYDDISLSNLNNLWSEVKKYGVDIIF